MVVTLRASGYKSGGEFAANSRFELEVLGCGTFYLDLHTSCSQPIEFNSPYDASPDGTVTLTGECGGCVTEPSSVQESRWGMIKKRYR